MDMIFTPAAILELLLGIDELSDYDIQITETLDGDIQLQIGDSIYVLQNKEENIVEVPEEVVEQIDDINMEAYQELDVDIDDSIDTVSIESNLLSEYAKNLWLAGAAKLAKDRLKSWKDGKR